jgi:hypothetical protein
MLALLSGCGHVRVSGKYGDCAPYVRTKEQVYRKFYIRSLNVYNWPGKEVKSFFSDKILTDGYFKGKTIKITVDRICQYADDLLTAKYREGDISVDVVITFCGDGRLFGLWTIPFGFTYVLPNSTGCEFDFEIGVRIDGDNQFNRDNQLPKMKSMVRVHKVAAALPTGFLFLPPALPNGFQVSELRECVVNVDNHLDLTEILIKTVANGLAQQLKTYALDRLTMPDIDFK